MSADAVVHSVSVPAIGRAAVVLAALSNSDRALTFAELASRVALPKSSLHNICTALSEAGFVERSIDGRFQIGWTVVDLARGRLNGMSLVRVFQDTAGNATCVPETMVLSVLRGADVVYVALVTGSQRVAVRYEIGMRLPAAFTASGKAILSTLSDQRVRQIVGPVITSSSVAAGPMPVENLLVQLELARQRGFAIDDEETARGMICVGVPVIGRTGRTAVGAVAISAVKDGHDLDDSVRRVQDVAARVGSRIP